MPIAIVRVTAPFGTLTPIVNRSCASSNHRCRFGYRCMHVLLHQEWGLIDHKKTLRTYRKEG